MSDRPTSALARSIREALARHDRIHAWQLRTVRRAGLQTYLVGKDPEAARRTESEVHEAAVFVKNGELLGRASATLDAGDAGRITQRIDEAVFMAGLGGDAPWTLPQAEAWPRVQLFDPALAGDRARATSRGILEAWRSAVATHRGVRPSSMELFCSEDTTTLVNSAGLSAEASATRVSLLTLVLADGARPSERESWVEPAARRISTPRPWSDGRRRKRSTSRAPGPHRREAIRW